MALTKGKAYGVPGINPTFPASEWEYKESFYPVSGLSNFNTFRLDRVSVAEVQGEFLYRRVGDSLHARCIFRIENATTDQVLILFLPKGLAIDSNKVYKNYKTPVGSIIDLTSSGTPLNIYGTGTPGIVIIDPSLGYDKVVFSTHTASNDFATATINSILATTTDSIFAEFIVPIEGWDS